MEDNKKTLVLSIIGILVLVIAVVGVSFAMFSFSGTGTKENVITTGTVSLDFSNVEGGTDTNVINVDNQYPINDANGVSLENISKSKADFNVVANYNANMSINYELGIDSINGDLTAGAETIPANMVKVILVNSTGDALVGTKNGDKYTGVTVDSLSASAGTLITSNYLTSGTFTTSDKSDQYAVYAYLDDAYTLPVDSAQTTTDNGGTLARGTKSQKTTKKAEFSFKLIIKAAQA